MLFSCLFLCLSHSFKAPREPLRRPLTNSAPWNAENLAHIDVSKSNLSADAAEWYPTPRLDQENTVHSVQSRLQKFSIGGDNRENHQTQGDQKYMTQKQETDPTEDTTKLKEIIYQLTYDPGQFDTVFETFIDIIKPYSEDLDVCNTVADMLFDSVSYILLCNRKLVLVLFALFYMICIVLLQALMQSNFRYNAARLCFYVQEVCPFVRSRIHILCEKELLGRREKQQGLTLFLAELYTQLHYENIYGRSLMSALRNLLSSGQDSDIKCLCQALKVSEVYFFVKNQLC